MNENMYLMPEGDEEAPGTGSGNTDPDKEEK